MFLAKMKTIWSETAFCQPNSLTALPVLSAGPKPSEMQWQTSHLPTETVDACPQQLVEALPDPHIVVKEYELIGSFMFRYHGSSHLFRHCMTTSPATEEYWTDKCISPHSENTTDVLRNNNFIPTCFCDCNSNMSLNTRHTFSKSFFFF